MRSDLLPGVGCVVWKVGDRVSVSTSSEPAGAQVVDQGAWKHPVVSDLGWYNSRECAGSSS